MLDYMTCEKLSIKSTMISWYKSYVPTDGPAHIYQKAHSAYNSVRRYVTLSVWNFWSATKFYLWPNIASLRRQRSAENCEIKPIEISMLTNAQKIVKEIQTENNAKQPQNDISNLECWWTTSGLSFNGTKCKAHTFTPSNMSMTLLFGYPTT